MVYRLRQQVSLAVLGAQQYVEQAVIFGVAMCLVRVQLHLTLPDDVVDSRVLQDSVSFLQLAHAADAEE